MEVKKDRKKAHYFKEGETEKKTIGRIDLKKAPARKV